MSLASWRPLLRDGDYRLDLDIAGKLHLKQVYISNPMWSRYMLVWKNFVSEGFLLVNIDCFFHWLNDSFQMINFLFPMPYAIVIKVYASKEWGF